ncbi:haloacid dehalogenase-like hydrolase domain-containing protein 3 [Chanos chanos]|uniref:Haloacid dehalogenase-like hydrolase domain-containing protein 3 n=1 Tax=Chanos chanos TaxID=29144 RepID=A0A6J2VN56_CHACN|nr:haloacid dehalogenase-like hydrolase domain-containing protein 3 [Chanos chanos]
MRGPLRWVFWDVKDTLLKVRRSVGEQYGAEARRLGLSLPAPQVEEAFRKAYRQYAQLYPNYGSAQGMGGQAWWEGVVRNTFTQCGVQDPATLDSLAHNLYHNFKSPENWEVFPDSKPTLKACVSLGLKLAVVSNFDNRLEGILRGCDLLSHFTLLITSESAGVAKPDPAIFTKALRQSGVPPTSVAHVGDHYLNDYLASRSLGIHGYLLNRLGRDGHPEVPPRHVLQRLDELPARLKQHMD